MEESDLAVLTGDIIRSSRLAPEGLDAAMAALERATVSMAGWRVGPPPRFTRFRGDGWQCLAPSPCLALRAVLFLRAHLRSLGGDVDTRASVGVGPGRVPAGADLSSAGGPAFEISGRALDGMARAQNFTVAWTDPPQAAAALGGIFALCDEISRHWTPHQADLMVEMLSPGEESQQTLGDRRGVSQQAIGKLLRGAGEWALREALAALEGDAGRHTTS